ncbi:selenide, water dikinase [Anaerocolumna cellulosilytica]|uniref:Selenide, water dikinase n=1 Tax=Anaerocolumna cellulosilytica TaxID=433286 RepID=A0A6S6QR76_9FIRM|nr:selenide, water dikinase SelD [Anaerocolumna cellulosilytica]MBB5195599.1 selenide,water dikinase [Anaerocolumna cellulosilytica]BCJ93843.1 selenide, water dikinase [Anaerocolumna cellulosilytica]
MEEKSKVRLTTMSTKAGCAAKFGPGNLAKVMAHMNRQERKDDPNLIVGFGTCDDAGVYKIAPDYALIQTVDFFTPIVDDPYTFGAIAATNALSDVYAMGGTPLTALNICCFSTGLDPEVYAEILQGGLDKVTEAGAVVLGGHTVTDNEVKFGVSVTGRVHPDKVLTNGGAKPGDVLILTKPIGTGVLSTAFKNEMICEEDMKEAITSMSTLNKTASEAAQKIGVNACTDVTGFGLSGHSYEVAAASNVNIRINISKVPVMEGVLNLIEKECIPGGGYANRSHYEKWIEFEGDISDIKKALVFDPQTSGGLLLFVPKEKALDLVRELKERGTLRSQVIGEVMSKTEGEKFITYYEGE